MIPGYQCLQKCGSVLLAATTSHLDTFDISNGSRISRWSCPLADSQTTSKETLQSDLTLESIVQKPGNSSIEIVPDSEPLAKKRRLSPEADIVPTDAKMKRQKERPRTMKPATQSSEAPNIITLNATRDGKHVILVTGEDKTIRVLEHDGRGFLKQINERTMPKRPCAIALTYDDSTIICADKFGDVFSLPLIATPDWDAETSSPSTGLDRPAEAKPFVSAANNLTIHTARNRRALENQIKQSQNRPKQSSEKSELKFEHTLLLGHVSMLTDVAYIRRNGRSYIVTADRDEHIRISRGIPQAHIIEGFCLGHNEFVSKICFPEATPGLMVSGGGDDDLFIWDWQRGKLTRRIDLRGLAEDCLLRSGAQASTDLKITVSGLYDLGVGSDDNSSTIAVTCEGVPAVFLFLLDTDCSTELSQILHLAGNPLAVEVDHDTDQVIVSLDYVHEVGSTTTTRPSTGDRSFSPVKFFRKRDAVWAEESLELTLETIDQAEATSSLVDSLSGIFYTLGNLRKRGGEE